MQKRVFGRKFSRGRKGRIALFRSLIRAIVLNGKITTTRAKAKAVQANLEKFVTLGKAGGIKERRKVLSEIGNDREVADKIFSSLALLFKSRPGGYTKITYLSPRVGDAAPMARIEWTEAPKEKSKEDKSDKSQKTKVKEAKEKTKTSH